MVEYSSTVWDPHFKEDIHNIEMVQRKAARIVLNKHNLANSVTTMLQSLKWSTLEWRRRFLKLTLMFKILNNQFYIPMNNIQLDTTHTWGYQHHHIHLPCNCESLLIILIPHSSLHFTFIKMIDHPNVQQISKNPQTLYIQVISNTCGVFQKVIAHSRGNESVRVWESDNHPLQKDVSFKRDINEIYLCPFKTFKSHICTWYS